MSKSNFNLIYEVARDIEEIQTKSVDAFVSKDRNLAIATIQLHKNLLEKTHAIRPRDPKTDGTEILPFLDLLQRIKNYEKSWSDILDLIQPSYK